MAPTYPTYPILLAHGIARFDVLLRAFLQDDAAGEDCTHYFRLIRSTLRTAGFDVHHSMVPWAEGLTVRSRVLRANVEAVLAATGAAKVHIIAHSMGGLDARRMLFDGQDDGLHKRIASVTTIGTPHNGTSFADWGVASQALLLAVMTQLGITTIDGVRDLTTDACTTFNDRAERFELGCGVAFRAHAGAQALPLVFEPMKLPWHIIKFHEGDNDGLVPVSSARWRPEFAAPAVLDADHLNQVGWWEPNDLGLTLGFTRFPPRLHLPESPEAVGRRIRGFYLEVAQDLAKRFPTGA
jgi:triacylglycerol lipase